MIFILIFHTVFIPEPCSVQGVITRKYIGKLAVYFVFYLSYTLRNITRYVL